MPTHAPYSPQVIDHFSAPRNLGRLPDASGRGAAGDLLTGDVRIEIAIRVDGGRIVAARHRTFGCSAAIAAASVATELIEGRAPEAAAALGPAAIEAALGGLPPERRYAPELAAEAIRNAVADWSGRAAAGDEPHE